ncbi:hypothetical protein [Streptomyces sp. NPDC055085]
MKYVKKTSHTAVSGTSSFRLKLFWGKTEFDTYVRFGTQNGGISIAKDHP